MGGDLEDFRAQLVVPQQLQLYDYWFACCAGDSFARRETISPSAIPHLLPYVSLIDAGQGGAFQIRLAGTQLREVFDREITGLAVSELERISNEGYWHRACASVVETGDPLQGAIRSPRITKDHLVQFWMRLPLSRTGEKIDQILGFDICLPAGEVSTDMVSCDVGPDAAIAI